MDGEILEDVPQVEPVQEEAMNHVEEPVADGMLTEPEAEQPTSSPPAPNGTSPEQTKDEDMKPPSSPAAVVDSDGVPNYKTRYIMSGHARSISAIKFSPDGTMLASCGECS